MAKYIALFRGINVGGKNILPMKALVAIFTEVGCSQVQTYIQSGNVVFEWKGKHAKMLCPSISSKVMEQFGFSPEVLMLTPSDLERAIVHNPFDTTEGKALHFFFLTAKVKSDELERLETLKSGREQVLLHKDVFYLYAPDGVGRSKLAAGAGRAFKAATARNWNTIQKLLTMLKS